VIRRLFGNMKAAKPVLAAQADIDGLTPFQWGPSNMFPLPDDEALEGPRAGGWHFVTESKVDAGQRYMGPGGPVTTTMVDPEQGATMHGLRVGTVSIPTILMVKDPNQARRQLQQLSSGSCEVPFGVGTIEIRLLPTPQSLPRWSMPVQLSDGGDAYVAETRPLAGDEHRVVDAPVYAWQLSSPDGNALAVVQSQLTAYIRPVLNDVEFFIVMLVLLTGLRLLLVPPMRTSPSPSGPPR